MLSGEQINSQLIENCKRLLAQADIYNSACALWEEAEARGASALEMAQMDEHLNLMRKNLDLMIYELAASTPSSSLEAQAYLKVIDVFWVVTKREALPELALVRSVLAYVARLTDRVELVGPTEEPHC